MNMTTLQRDALHHLLKSPAIDAHLQAALATAHKAGDVTGRLVAQYLAYGVRRDPAIGTAVKIALAGAGPEAQHLALAWLAQHPDWTCDRPDPAAYVRWREICPF